MNNYINDLELQQVEHRLSQVRSLCHEVNTLAHMKMCSSKLDVASENVPPERLYVVELIRLAYGHSEHRPGKRQVPSAGARYPTEVFCAYHEGRNKFVIYYDALEDAFYKLDLVEDWIAQAILAPLQLEDMVFLFGSSYARTVDRYGYRGVRYCLLDMAHLVSNFVELTYDLSPDHDIEAPALSAAKPEYNFSPQLPCLAILKLKPKHRRTAEPARPVTRPDLSKAGIAVEFPSLTATSSRARLFFDRVRRSADNRLPGYESFTRAHRTPVQWIHERHSARGFLPRSLSEPAASEIIHNLASTATRCMQDRHACLEVVIVRRDVERGRATVIEIPGAGPSREIVFDGDTEQEWLACFNDQPMSATSPLTVFFGLRFNHADSSGDFYNRYVNAHFLTSFLSADLYQLSLLLGIGTTMVCGFSDTRVRLILDRPDFLPIAVQFIGEIDENAVKTDLNYLNVGASARGNAHELQ